MIPILYGTDETNITGNGLGRLSEALSCEVEETVNGPYILTMEYPAGGIHSESIKPGSIIKALPAEDVNEQLFRVKEISKDETGIITYKMEHISYDLLKKVVNTHDPTSTVTGAEAALTELKNRIVPYAEQDKFTFETNIASSATWSVKNMPPGSVREFLGGREGSILDTFGGEFEWDNLKVILHAARGQDNGVVISYGRNLTDISQEIDAGGAYSEVFPFYYKEDANINITTGSVTWNAGNMLFLADQAEPVLKIPGATISGCALMDLTEYFEEPPTSIDELRNMAYAKLASFSGVPSESTKAGFVPLWQTIDYEKLINQKVHLCDTVRIRYPGLDIDVVAKVTKTNFNVLSEKYNSIEVGTSSDLYDTIQDMIGSSNTVVSRQNNLITASASASSFSSGTSSAEVTSIIAPQDGTAIISGYVSIANNSSGSRHAEIQVNGTIVGQATVLAASGAQTRVQVSGIASVSDGDEISLKAWQSSGASRNISGELQAYFMSK